MVLNQRRTRSNHSPTRVNCAHRMTNLREVDFFEPGCIGAEDVVLDAKIQRAGHKIFIDPSNVMPHRRRKPFVPFMKQMKLWLHSYDCESTMARNCNMVTHGNRFFPLISSFHTEYGSRSCSKRFSLFPSMGPRIAIHVPATLMIVYILICWVGAAIGTSPHRTLSTVLLHLCLFFSHNGRMVRRAKGLETDLLWRWCGEEQFTNRRQRAYGMKSIKLPCVDDLT